EIVDDDDDGMGRGGDEDEDGHSDEDEITFYHSQAIALQFTGNKRKRASGMRPAPLASEPPSELPSDSDDEAVHMTVTDADGDELLFQYSSNFRDPHRTILTADFMASKLDLLGDSPSGNVRTPILRG